ncbi:hypothetical protein [Brucella sp. 2716]|uniref:hypothetical protein n=1 Tax=Brucella sp. 2716 TaxID=2975052 RepID=UPI00217DC097|nr:hypothetical protein [Brucella sp. 2716]UWF59419.1 hypothetical protein NYO66_02505 [Brucella sp. 2716]
MDGEVFQSEAPDETPISTATKTHDIAIPMFGYSHQAKAGGCDFRFLISAPAAPAFFAEKNLDTPRSQPIIDSFALGIVLMTITSTVR